MTKGSRVDCVLIFNPADLLATGPLTQEKWQNRQLFILEVTINWKNQFYFLQWHIRIKTCLIHNSTLWTFLSLIKDENVKDEKCFFFFFRRICRILPRAGVCFFTPLFNLFKKNYPLFIAKKVNSPHIGPNMALTLSTVSYTFKYRVGKYLNPIKTGGQGESESRKRPCWNWV